MTKRVKFVLTSLLLSFGFLLINIIDFEFRFFAIGALGILTIILFWFSLSESIRKDGTTLVVILPFLFTTGVGLFWFLLPGFILARIPVIVFYCLGLYALALTSNIFTVSAIRTIALVRAARGVGFVLTLVTSFLLFDAIFSMHINFFATYILVFAISFLLFLQGLWSSTLERKFSKSLFLYSLFLSISIVQIAMILIFWPVTVVTQSLFLTVGIYVLLGLGQAQLEGRLFQKTIQEYLTVGSVVFLAMFIFTQWGA